MSVQHGAWGVASCNFQPPLSKNPRSAAGYRDVVAMEMGPHVAPANKNVAPGAKQLLIINISNYTVL